MAQKFCNTSGTLSTTATWLTVDTAVLPAAYSTTYTDVYNAGSGQATGNALTLPSCNVQGVFLYLRVQSATSSPTFTVELLKGGAQVAISSSINVSSLTSSIGWTYVPFSSPYVATASSTYGVRVKSSASGKLNWFGNSAATWCYGIVSDSSTTKPSSGDTVYVKNGVTLTIDENATFGPTSAHSLIMGDGSGLTVGQPGSSITMALGAGDIHAPTNVAFNLGSSGARVGAARFIMTTTLPLSSYIVDAPPDYVQVNWTSTFNLYGNITNDLRLNLDADAAAGQTTVSTAENIPASWTVGDTVYLCGKDQTTVDNTTFTIATKSTKSLTLSSNILTNKYLKGAAIVNITEGQRNLGIHIKSTNTISWCRPGSKWDYFNFDGVYFENVALVTGIDSTTSANTNSVNNISIYCPAGALSYPVNILSTYKSGLTISNVHSTCSSTSSALPVIFTGKNGVGSNITMRNYAYASTGVGVISGNNNVLTGYVGFGLGDTAFMGYANIVNDSYVFGGRIALNSTFATFNNVNQQRSANYGLIIYNAFATLNNCTIGIGATNATKDIYHATDYYSQITLNNCNIGSQGVDSNITTATSGSWLRSINHNNTAGEYRSWYPEGLFYYTSATSGKIEAWSQMTATLTNRYKVSTDTVAGMSILASINCALNNYTAYTAGTYEAPKMYVDYDNGTTASSTAAVNTNATQVLLTTFSPSTSNNPINVRLTQKTSDYTDQGEVKWDTLSITARQYPYVEYAYTKYINQTTDDYIANIPSGVTDSLITVTNPATVAAYTGISINHGTETIAVTSAHTGTELYDYCQYNLDLTANLAYPKFFYSIDGGLSYTSNYDVTISGGNVTSTKTLRLTSGKVLITAGAYWTGLIDGDVHLTTTGAYNLRLDTNNLTFTTAGTYDLSGSTITGTVTLINTSGGAVTVKLNPAVSVVNTGPNITLDNVVPVLAYGNINNILAGSRLQVYNTTTSTEMYNGTPGTSYSYSETWTGDYDVRIRITKAGYLPIQATATFTSSGFSYNADQQADTTYNTNGIDGSTVTEFSVSGTTIKAYVDDTDNSTTVQRLYNWWQYNLTTSTGIANQWTSIRAIDPTNYQAYTSFQIYNQKATPLMFGGGYIVPNTGGTFLDVYDTAGGPIFMGYGHVVGFAYSSGSGLTTDQSNKLDNIYSKTSYIPNEEVLGTDTFLALK